MEQPVSISQEQRNFISYLRGFAILTIIFGHVGGYWFLEPYSSYLHLCGSTFFFFLAGGVLYHSFHRSVSVQRFYLARFSNLLLPYYCICLVSLLFFLLSGNPFPELDWEKLVAWIAIRPRNETMPFPLGQLWFLHTYVMIMAFAPVFFYAYDRKRPLFFGIGALFLVLSVLKLFFNLDSRILLLGWNFYNLSFFGLFFLGGIVTFSNREGNLKRALVALLLLASCIRLVLAARGNPVDLTESFNNRDFLFVISSSVFISVVVLAQNTITGAIAAVKPAAKFLLFLHQHAFSVYLLHTFSIHLSEQLLGLTVFEGKTLLYGITKLQLVLVMVCLMAVPFTRMSKSITSLLVFRAAEK